MTTPRKGKEHDLKFTSNKTCEKCGGKYVAKGGIKSITRIKTCPECKKKSVKKHNDDYNKKKRKTKWVYLEVYNCLL